MSDSSPVAVIGWHDGLAGAVQAWLEAEGVCRVGCFVHPEDALPVIDVDKERARRKASLFDFPENQTFKQRPLIVSRNWVFELRQRGIGRVVPAYHDPRRRLELIKEAEGAGIEVMSAVHPSVIIMQEVAVGRGSVIYEGAIIGYRAEIGAGCIIGPGSMIGHHAVLGDCVDFNGKIIFGANAVAEPCAEIYSGANIMAHMRIGASATVGIGSLVMHNVAAETTVFGAPAIKIPGKNKV